MPVRLSPIIDPAPDAILTGDPRRAFALAHVVTVQPEMSHLARGLWGKTGDTAGGRRLTVQFTGIGGPAAATVIADLAALGVKRIVRLGTCVATGEARAPGSRGPVRDRDRDGRVTGRACPRVGLRSGGPAVAAALARD